MPPAVIDLTGLSPSQGFIIQGDAAGDSAGWSVSDAGDVNGDGVGDFIIGAPKGDDSGANAGEAYVIYGRVGTTRPRLDLTILTAADGFIIRGDSAANYAGLSVNGGGDVNGDGIDDLIVGAPYNGDGGSAAGAAYVIYGQAGSARSAVDLTDLAAGDGFVIQGDESGDQAGFSIADAGDVNGDGIDDVIVGAQFGDSGGVESGEVFVIYGRVGNTRGRLDLSSLTSSEGFVVRGAASGDSLGRSVSGAGDVNGDGIGDLIIGARDADSGGYAAGEAYVIYGQTGATRTSISLSNLAASDGFAIQGDEEYDEAGFSVSDAGDVNGDGIDDFLVGARYGGIYGRYAGEVYVVYGRTGAERGRLDLTNFTTSDGFIILGEESFSQAGRSIASAGDVIPMRADVDSRGIPNPVKL